jgi:protein SCO1
MSREGHDPQPAPPEPQAKLETPRGTSPGMPLRWLAVGAAAIVAFAALGIAAWTRTHEQNLSLQGAVLTPPVDAYDFRLPDAGGRTVSLSSLRGRVVVLTFLYTHCPDICPLIADTLHRSYERLGPLTTRAAFVAVSVDPLGDTPQAVRGFLKDHHVNGELTYLRGSFALLRPVWAHYYVGSDASDVRQTAGPSRPGANQVGHTAVVYIIDPRGKIMVFLPGNFDPKDLVTDIRLLAGPTGTNG